jgi:hypothetical protein
MATPSNLYKFSHKTGQRVIRAANIGTIQAQCDTHRAIVVNPLTNLYVRAR